MTNAGPLEVKAKCGLSEVPVTVQGEFRGTITLAASAEDIGVGSNVTFTASLTPAVTAENLVWSGPQVWLPVPVPPYRELSPELTGGFTKMFFFDNAGEQTVTNTWGTSSASKTIRVYAVTAVMASDPLVPVGSNLTFTATLMGGTNLPLLTWFVDGNTNTNTGITATITYTNAAEHTVSVTCGTSSNDIAITAVGVKWIESLAPDALGVFAPSPLFVLKANAIQFRAIPDPEKAAWPPGMPTWQIEGSSLTNAEPSWSFQNQSALTNDTKLVIAKRGTSSSTNMVTVFSISLVPEKPELANDYAGVASVDRVNRSVTRLDARIAPAVLGLQLTVAIDSANPNTSDKGQFVIPLGPGPLMSQFGPFLPTTGSMNSNAPLGDTYSSWYAAKQELSTHRDRDSNELKSQTVTINVLLNQVNVASRNVTVLSHFMWLLGKNWLQQALNFVNMKYGVGVSNPTIATQDPYGLTSATYFGINVTISPATLAVAPGVTGGENWTAAILYHEQTHVLRGAPTLLQIERGETAWELWGDANKAPTALSAAQFDAIIDGASEEMIGWNSMLGVANAYYLTEGEKGLIRTEISEYADRIKLVNEKRGN